MLFSKLDNREKTLVRSRLQNRGSSNPGRINFKSASDKLESNLITETPLCDVVESFVYPRRGLSSLLIIDKVVISTGHTNCQI